MPSDCFYRPSNPEKASLHISCEAVNGGSTLCVSRFFPGAVDVENIDAWKKRSSDVAWQSNQYWSNTRSLEIICVLQETRQISDAQRYAHPSDKVILRTRSSTIPEEVTVHVT